MTRDQQRDVWHIVIHLLALPATKLSETCPKIRIAVLIEGQELALNSNLATVLILGLQLTQFLSLASFESQSLLHDTGRSTIKALNLLIRLRHKVNEHIWRQTLSRFCWTGFWTNLPILAIVSRIALEEILLVTTFRWNKKKMLYAACSIFNSSRIVYSSCHVIFSSRI